MNIIFFLYRFVASVDLIRGITACLYFKLLIILLIISLDGLGRAESCISTFEQFMPLIRLRALNVDSCLVFPPTTLIIFLRESLFRYFLCLLLYTTIVFFISLNLLNNLIECSIKVSLFT